MGDNCANTDDELCPLDKFLKLKITCKYCHQGPSNFSILLNIKNNEYYSKWGEYCSMGCNIYYQNNGGPKPYPTKLYGG